MKFFCGIIGYSDNGNENPVDILSKHWGYRQIWKLLQPLLFWRRDTKDVDVLDIYKAPLVLSQISNKRGVTRITQVCVLLALSLSTK